MDTGNLPVAAGFAYGTSSGALIDTAFYSGSLNSASGQFSVALKPLNPNTTYYVKPFLRYSSNEVVGASTSSFNTSSHSWQLAERGYLELPAINDKENYVGTFYSSGASAANRNYTYNYSYRYLGSLWVAYPLTASHISGSYSSSNWQNNSNIPDDYELTGSDILSSSYPSNFVDASAYSKGHQIPNADRTSNGTMNQQTYYMTNQTPQIANGFNGGVWNNLETAIRSLTSSTDTVYVVTGACYRKAGGSEKVNKLVAQSSSNVSPKEVSVPNYYWKVLLKVKRTNGAVTSASAIGFWFEHKSYDSGTSYASYAKSVSQIETWTGFDFFTNLPESLKAAVKANNNWSTFQSF